MQLEHLIKHKIKQLGFDDCRFSKAAFLEEEAPRLEKWLDSRQHGEMKYMENYFDIRLDPTKLLSNAKTVISMRYNYFPKSFQTEDSYHISKYAYGKDYHKVIKKKLISLLKELQLEIGDFVARAFVDSAPIMEKAWGAQSGLGWIGKNSNLISREKGSFFFLAEVVTDLELIPDPPIADYCGTCTRCIEACPTQAIEKPYEVNGSKCISYFTIELKEDIPSEFKNTFEDWMFGCDICQDVCPWNRFSQPSLEEKFQPHSSILKFTKKEWEELSEEAFDKIFQGSAVKRTKYSGLKRNINFISNAKNQE